MRTLVRNDGFFYSQSRPSDMMLISRQSDRQFRVRRSGPSRSVPSQKHLFTESEEIQENVGIPFHSSTCLQVGSTTKRHGEALRDCLAPDRVYPAVFLRHVRVVKVVLTVF
jgi:hypothetical protein